MKTTISIFISDFVDVLDWFIKRYKEDRFSTFALGLSAPPCVSCLPYGTYVWGAKRILSGS